MTRKITIIRKKHHLDRNPEIYSATFRPVRRIKNHWLGWATVEHLTFPAIVSAYSSREDVVLTVKDWQAPRSTFADDLSDPVEVARQLSSDQGTFVTPSGAVSVVPHYFTHSTS